MKNKYYSSDILENSLKELLYKKKDIELELINLNSTIDGIKTLLHNIDVPAEETKQIIIKKKARRTRTPNKIAKATEESVRDAIIEIYKKPFSNYRGVHKLRDGYFTSSIIAPLVPISRTSSTLRFILDKFEEKGMLESSIYKSGKQYRYIPPAETGPGKDFEKFKRNVNKLSPRSEPVPHTGNNRITFRNKDVESMVDKAKSEGFNVKRLGSDHIRVYKNENDKIATISTTGRDIARYVENCKADLKRIGVNV